MKIVLATHNKNKVRELSGLFGKYLGDIELMTLDEAGIYGEIEENGSSFEENALIKARAAAESGFIGVADDSGLCVEALGGAPGIYSARYAGEHGDDGANNRLLLENLAGNKNRKAEFVCSIACVFPDGRAPICVRGRVEGEILESPRGNDGFGYDPLFLYKPYGKTFAEISREEKNEISHRGMAVRLFCEELIRSGV
ncbi:MAG: RdgB/HAM1 family non-canonical purine NTP pyrophosphatase [Eubacteriales bacterium]